MYKNKTKWLDNINLVFVGLALGFATGMVINIHIMHDHETELEQRDKNITAFKDYYHNVETLLDSLDYTYSLCLEDGALQSTAGEDYLDAKAKVDSLIFKQY